MSKEGNISLGNSAIISNLTYECYVIEQISFFTNILKFC